MKLLRRLEDLLLGLCAVILNHVRVNKVSRGSERWQKRRAWWAPAFIAPGNVFFKVSNAHILMHVDPGSWRSWESRAHRELYGAECESVGQRVLLIPDVVGVAVSSLHSPAVLALAMRAFGRELARVHRSPRAEGGYWSHGDSHLHNAIYEAESPEVEHGRVRLLDFETRHRSEVSVASARADDLFVASFDMIRHPHTRESTSYVSLFLEAYRHEYAAASDKSIQVVLASLAARCKSPTVLELLLWKMRFDALDRAVLERWVGAIRNVVTAM